MATTKIRMKVLEPFSRNLDGQILTGNPQHPSQEGRFVSVTETAALALEKENLAKRYSLKDEAREELEEEERQALEAEAERQKALEAEGKAGGQDDPANLAGARTSDLDQNVSSQQERDANVSGNGQTDATGKTARRTAKATGPVNGLDTNATTNHPTTVVNGDGTTGTSSVPNAAPDPDAAP